MQVLCITPTCLLLVYVGDFNALPVCLDLLDYQNGYKHWPAFDDIISSLGNQYKKVIEIFSLVNQI